MKIKTPFDSASQLIGKSARPGPSAQSAKSRASAQPGKSGASANPGKSDAPAWPETMTGGSPMWAAAGHPVPEDPDPNAGPM